MSVMPEAASPHTDQMPNDFEAAGHDEFHAAVVVVNYRTPKLVEECLTSVQADSGGLRLQTVVVNNASTDGSVERLRTALPWARVVSMEENRGFATGVNAGFGHTSAETVVVLNPDTTLHPGALGQLVEHMRGHARTGVVAPLLDDAEGQLSPNGYRRFPGLLTLGLDLCLPFGYLLVHAPGLHPYVMSPASLALERSFGGGPPGEAGLARATERR
jgi:glycosyltransferase involved in cell wall biosynthesis